MLMLARPSGDLMTPAPAYTALPDLRAIPLGEMPGMPSVTLDRAVRRVLPGAAPAQDQGAFFNSSV